MFWQTILKRKKLVIFIVIILIAGGYYYYTTTQANKTSVSYITGTVEKGTISVTVTGSGQVSDLNKVDLKPLGSGEVTDIKVKNGDLVKADQVIATLDQRSNDRSLQQASASLSSAQASFSKVLAGTTASDIKASQNSLNQSQLSYNNSLTSLDNTTKSATETLSQAQKTLADLTSLITSPGSGNKRDAVVNTIDDQISAARSTLDAENKILSDQNLKPTLSIINISYLNLTNDTYAQAQALFIKAQTSLATVKGYESDSNIDIASTDTLALLSKILSSTQYLFSALQNSITSSILSQAQLDTYKSSMSSQSSSMSSAITNLQGAVQTLKDAILSAQNNLNSTTLSTGQQISSAKAQVDSATISLQIAKDALAKLKAPVSQQDIQIARSQLISAQTQLQSAQDAYDNNIIKAPFAGQVAELAVQKGDQITSATVIASLITEQKIAVMPFNETDIAKIKAGQAVVLTFDALPDITLTGKVGDVDLIGTATQGVVTYNVKIVFDTQNDSVKSGMSVNASIITASKTDVLMVVNSAVKSDNSGSYVQVLDSQGQPQNKDVTVGLANDTDTEITNGLNEGDQIVTQVVTTGASSTTNTSSSSSVRIPGLTGGGGFGGARGN
jgi:HlyD family secretion protein